MSLKMQQLSGDSSYIITYSTSNGVGKCTLITNPWLGQNFAEPGLPTPFSSPFEEPFPELSMDNANVKPDIIIISGSYSEKHLRPATFAGYSLELCPAKILGNPETVSKIKQWCWFPHEKLYPLKRNTPYIRFFSCGHVKVEIELLGTRAEWGASDMHLALGIKFGCYQTLTGDYEYTTCLFAPHGVVESQARAWCETIGNAGTGRVTATEWNLDYLVELPGFLKRRRGRGKLDVMLHPFDRMSTTSRLGTAMFYNFAYNGGISICKSMCVGKWVRTSDERQLLDTVENGSRGGMDLFAVEEALRMEGVVVLDSVGAAPGQGVCVTEFFAGREYTVSDLVSGFVMVPRPETFQIQ